MRNSLGFLVVLCACFSVSEKEDSGTEGETENDSATDGMQSSDGADSDGPTGGGSASATSGASESDSASADGSGDATAGNDAPPTVSVTVAGTTTPDPVTQSRPIALQAEAEDDNGVTGVEFFVGERSVGVDDEAPYEITTLVTSRETGTQPITARATDTAGQSTQSDPVELEVNITGGELLASDTAMGQTPESSPHLS